MIDTEKIRELLLSIKADVAERETHGQWQSLYCSLNRIRDKASQILKLLSAEGQTCNLPKENDDLQSRLERAEKAIKFLYARWFFQQKCRAEKIDKLKDILGQSDFDRIIGGEK